MCRSRGDTFFAASFLFLIFLMQNGWICCFSPPPIFASGFAPDLAPDPTSAPAPDSASAPIPAPTLRRFPSCLAPASAPDASQAWVKTPRYEGGLGGSIHLPLMEDRKGELARSSYLLLPAAVICSVSPLILHELMAHILQPAAAL